MNPRVFAIVVCMLAASCGTAESSTTPLSTPIGAATPPPATAPVPTSTSTTSTAPSTSVAATSTTVVAGPGVGVPVTGGDLPSVVVDEQLAMFGELLDPVSFMDRYQLHGMPYADGAGVAVVDHQQLVQVFDGGARRFDTLSYAFMDNRTAIEILDTFMQYTGADLQVGPPWQVDGGTCTQAGGDGESFTFIACIRDDGSRMVQVVRDEWLDGNQTPPAEIQAAIDAATPVVTGVAGQLAIWDLRRSVNFAGGHAVSIDFDTDPPTIETLNVLLPGWNERPDSGYGPELTNGTAYWIITETGLLYVDPHPSTWG